MTRLQTNQLRHQVAQQLEALLFVGFKLDLQQLLQPALRFMRSNSQQLITLTAQQQAQEIFSQRVLAAAGSASGVELLSRSFLQQPLGCGFGVDEEMFTDVRYDRADEGAAASSVHFTGTLTRDLCSFEKGTRLHATFTSGGNVKLRDADDNTTADSDSDEYDMSPSTGLYSFGVVLGPLHTLSLHD
jgi:hypothetical protein